MMLTLGRHGKARFSQLEARVAFAPLAGIRVRVMKAGRQFNVLTSFEPKGAGGYPVLSPPVRFCLGRCFLGPQLALVKPLIFGAQSRGFRDPENVQCRAV